MSEFISFNTIIGNGKAYQVPIYQRDYSWDKDDWEDLWNDIEEIPIDKTHYLGYIVLQPQKEEDPIYWVIDGQQRLTTLSILALAVTALLKKWVELGVDSSGNQIRIDKITERYLGNYSLSKLNLAPKLKLNRNNDDFYRSFLLNLRNPPSLSKLKPSQKLLQRAFTYFFEQLEVKFGENQSGAEISDYLEKTVGNGIVFTQIVVSNDLDAFKVFETLNARGVKLSTADLLKNYLFKLTHQLGELDLEEAERRWQHITNTIHSNDLTTFIRHYWNSKYRLERQPTLFKAIKREITTASDAFKFLDNLESMSVYYSSFNNPDDEIWDKEYRSALRLIKLLNISTCYSLMLSALVSFEKKDITNLLKEISIIAFRYNLSDLNPNEAERIFSKVAKEISDGSIQNARDAILSLKSLYVIDSNFEQIFSTMSINTRRKKDLVKYILVKLENQIANKDYNTEENISTIEHILPENPGEVWALQFPLNIQNDFIYRIGNFTLLEASINHKLDNNIIFSEKQKKYKTSSYLLSNEYCNYEIFSPKEIDLRQNKLAKIAKTVWKSSYL